MKLQQQKHKWDEECKIIQAKHDKWSKKEYGERLNNIQYNYQHLLNIIDSEDYDLHHTLINQVKAHEDKIEILLKIHEKKVEKEEYLKNNPPESFIARIAKKNKKPKKRNNKVNLHNFYKN